MKKYLLAIVTSLMLTHGLYSQTADKQQIATIEKTIKEIQTNISKYKKTEVIKDSLGNSRDVYKDGNELKLVKVYFKDSDADKSVEWYFSNRQLVYCQQNWTDKKTNSPFNNQKYYLNNGHLLAGLVNDKPIDINSEAFKNVEATLPEYGTKMIAETK